MLTEWNPGTESKDEFICNYYLGQLLFLELLENLGENEFKERLRELYRLSLTAKEADGLPVSPKFGRYSMTNLKSWKSTGRAS